MSHSRQARLRSTQPIQRRTMRRAGWENRTTVRHGAAGQRTPDEHVATMRRLRPSVPTLARTSHRHVWMIVTTVVADTFITGLAWHHGSRRSSAARHKGQP